MTGDAAAALRRGELTVLGRIRSASNATFLCEATLGEDSVRCVYKPVAGEEPLWDFPDGTLAGREVGAYRISAQLGWKIVPDTIVRDGPAGPGMLQLWVDQPGGATSAPQSRSTSNLDLVDVIPGDTSPPGYLPVLRAYGPANQPVTLVHADDARLLRMAVFDVLINNADRKGGHVLRGGDGGIYGVDHGVCLHVEDKLRTVLWGWAGDRLDDQTLETMSELADALRGPLAEALRPHISAAEVAALRRRTCALLDHPVMPGPDRAHPIPWPAF